MKKNNKRGFTLVELLAVIVILAVVMLIGVTSVGPLMTKSRKGALGSEGLSLVDAAKLAYQAEQLNMKSGAPISQTTTACFDLAWLYNNQYYQKGKSGDGYAGSVLVKYDNGHYIYNFWISNGTYSFSNVDIASYDASAGIESTAAASNVCGGQTTGNVYCTAAAACAKK